MLSIASASILEVAQRSDCCRCGLHVPFVLPRRLSSPALQDLHDAHLGPLIDHFQKTKAAGLKLAACTHHMAQAQQELGKRRHQGIQLTLNFGTSPHLSSFATIVLIDSRLNQRKGCTTHECPSVLRTKSWSFVTPTLYQSSVCLNLGMFASLFTFGTVVVPQVHMLLEFVVSSISDLSKYSLCAPFLHGFRNHNAKLRRKAAPSSTRLSLKNLWPYLRQLGAFISC